MASQPQRAQSNERPPIAGEAFLRALADHGIDYFFANPGTDFPPIVEAFSRAKQSNAKVPTAAGDPAREPRGRHGARRLCDERPAAGRHAARQRRHRQRHQQHHQPQPRQHPAHPRRRPHADHREGQVRRPQPLHPLGPGDVRPGRHAARGGEVGLRAARPRADHRRRLARLRDHHVEPARPGLSLAAARAAGGADAGAARPGEAAPRPGPAARRSER